MSAITNINYVDKIQILKSSDYFVYKFENDIQKDKIVLLLMSASWYRYSKIYNSV
uniref:Uncharacterized protein n=1 Tax=viral metagenome TaxID=1070528 RepID=A0A6C0EAU9_9ZZZZ